MTLSRLTNKESPQMMPVIAALKQALGDNLIAAVLFGSRARGDSNEFSDWDLLVIARGLPERPFQRHLYLKKMLPDFWRGQVAIVAKTPEEFEAHLPSLYLDIALDGRILFDTNEYATSHLSRLRQLIRSEGLRREQKKDDLIWRWQHFPGLDWSLEWETSP